MRTAGVAVTVPQEAVVDVVLVEHLFCFPVYLLVDSQDGWIEVICRMVPRATRRWNTEAVRVDL